MIFEKHIQFVTNNTGLHAYPALLGIYFQNTIHILGNVYHNTIAYTLARQRGARSAGDEGKLVLPGKKDDLAYILCVFGDGHRQR